MKSIQRYIICTIFLSIPLIGYELSLKAQAVVSDRAAARLLEQASWGPSSQSIESVKQMGMEGWIDQQFQIPTTPLPAQPITNLDGTPYTDLTPLQSVFIVNAVTGKDQLRQRVAFALSEIWVVSHVDIGYAYFAPPYWQLLSDNAFGNYRDLIVAISTNPAMGQYQNLANNPKAFPGSSYKPNENYARELMQLFTIGLNRLNIDGTPALNSLGKAIPTFSESDVQHVTLALTGWTFPVAPGVASNAANPPYYYGTLTPVGEHHDTSAKSLFGTYSLPAGQTAMQDLQSLADILMDQSSMAPFVSKQLIQHLVTSNPSAAYVRRVAAIFNNNGSGVRGDLRSVVKGILLDPEARAGDSDNSASQALFGHLREPLLMVTSLFRGLDVQPNTCGYPTLAIRQLRQSLFTSPSVFNYFSINYTLDGVIAAPEFDIYHTAEAVTRLDVVYWLLTGMVMNKWCFVDIVTPFKAYGKNIDSLLDEANRIFFHGTMPHVLRQSAIAAATAAGNQWDAMIAALFIILSSPEYQIVR